MSELKDPDTRAFYENVQKKYPKSNFMTVYDDILDYDKAGQK